MRNFIVGLIVVALAFAVEPAGAADGPPVFDIAGNCSMETAGSGMGRNCTIDKDQLTRRWSSFSARQKQECIGETTAGGDETSYVELLTCLEMYSGQFGDKK
ncbi:hypothetical protein [Bradyrhizobium sp.]|jgi:hypothetical protein|uniref:hypothetical protein n=1 Tax=Bradyrhizobium sp. TaxID=376 RepID=UPI002DDD42E7|nr:hypothetical protein [Bradyrhizobium sp.]HEV2160080.1 hypothetical protein [Bradyrhizobium sp.]